MEQIVIQSVHSAARTETRLIWNCTYTREQLSWTISSDFKPRLKNVKYDTSKPRGSAINLIFSIWIDSFLMAPGILFFFMIIYFSFIYILFFVFLSVDLLHLYINVKCILCKCLIKFFKNQKCILFLILVKTIEL